TTVSPAVDLTAPAALAAAVSAVVCREGSAVATDDALDTTDDPDIIFAAVPG
ncbi:hypothetical protein M9458_011468, partial [Cirrhinus mrigala]